MLALYRESDAQIADIGERAHLDASASHVWMSHSMEQMPPARYPESGDGVAFLKATPLARSSSFDSKVLSLLSRPA